MKRGLKQEMTRNRFILFSLIFFLLIGCFGKKKADSLFNNAVELWRNGKYVKAIEVFENFIDSYPNHPSCPEANLWIGDIRYLYLSEYVQALFDYRRLVDNYPKSEYAPIAQMKIAKILFEFLSEEFQSITEYQIFLKLYPNHSLAPEAQYNIAEIYAYLEDFKQAITEFELFLNKYPDSDMKINVYQRIGELYCLEKMFAKAIECLNKALELSKGEDEISRIKKIMADCYASQGDLSSGLSLYEEMLQKDPDNEILKHRVESLRTQIKISNSAQRYNW